jgi:hypothetical protein
MLSILFVFAGALAQIPEKAEEIKLPLESAKGLKLINVNVVPVNHQGKKGIEVSAPDVELRGETLVIIPDILFKDGSIELELTGEPAPGATPQMRGFVGVAFRVNPDNYSSYECFYLRPTNARANNQLQRNHSTQYIAHPEFPWYKLRQDSPGQYESYVDLVPGEWIRIKIEVAGKTARLYLHNASQPCLIVNDLKHGESQGKIALWLHSSTLARYRNLVVKAK